MSHDRLLGSPAPEGKPSNRGTPHPCSPPQGGREPARALTLWHYVADPLIFAVNQDIWDSFTEEDQAIVRQAAVEAGAYGIEVAREGLTEDDQSLIEKIRGNGVEVIALTDEERQAFVDATRPVYENWRERIGADLVGEAEESIANR